jgi:hypothetical protein
VKYAVELDKKFNPGVDMDTIIVNNNVGDIENNLILESFQNENTFIFNRPNNGGSFAAYIDVFLKYKKEYDYFIFTEEDIIIGGTENYYVNLINILKKSSKTVGFLALVGVGEGGYPKHAHGGIGIIKSSVLKKVYKSNPFIYEGWDRARSIGHEVAFTSEITRITGLDIIQFGGDEWSLERKYCLNYSNYKNRTDI